MDDVTYRDPAVIRLLNQRYVLVKVDQDSRPDIANRYQDWGWPATIVFAADGSEIVKRQGYIPPLPMASMLQAIIDDPSPGPSVDKEAAFQPASNSSLPPDLVARVKSSYEQQYDTAASGWGFGHKYLDRDSVEYALRLAAAGNQEYSQRLNATLHNARRSHRSSLGRHVSVLSRRQLVRAPLRKTHLHSGRRSARVLSGLRANRQCRIPSRRAGDSSLRRPTFSCRQRPAPSMCRRMRTCTTGKRTQPTSNSPMQPAARRAFPRVDTHVYARENGWMIAALCDDYAATGDASSLDQAQRAARWIRLNRGLPGGGFRHNDRDAAGPYLGDTLAMGQAFLSLYKVTGDRHDLESCRVSRTLYRCQFRADVAGIRICYLTNCHRLGL